MAENNVWHQVYFDWDDVRDGCLDTMQHQFELLWSDAGRPVEAALFLNRLVTGGRHIYFSPLASRIAPMLLERYVALALLRPKSLEFLRAHRYLLARRFRPDRDGRSCSLRRPRFVHQ
jgi:hypothetical protein